MFGPWDWKPSSGRMILEVAKAGVPFSPPGGSSVCDVRDVAQGVVAALRRGRSGKRYVLGGENITYFDLWCLIADATGTRRPRWKLGPVLQTLAGGAGDLWGKVARKEPELNSAAIKISTYYHYFSSRLAEEELGYTYRPARESIAAAKDWFQQQGYLK
jgi:dihydroflavonol-4-reductase